MSHTGVLPCWKLFWGLTGCHTPVVSGGAFDPPQLQDLRFVGSVSEILGKMWGFLFGNCSAPHSIAIHW